MKKFTQNQNATQRQNAALEFQKIQLLQMYDVADRAERKSVINHIYAFLSIVSKAEKIFRLKLIHEIEIKYQHEIEYVERIGIELRPRF